MRKLVAALALFSALALPSLALAVFNADSSGLNTTGDNAYGEQTPEQLSVTAFIGEKLLKPVLGLVGLTFLVLTVYAGILWMTSAGDEKRIKQAKDILVTSVLGAIIIASAYVITNTIIGYLSGPPVAAAVTTTP